MFGNATNKEKITKISISDCGVGLEYSFKKRQEKFGGDYTKVFNMFSTAEQEKYKNFLYIFEALHYSKEKSTARDNLYTLLSIVLRKNDNYGVEEGTIRIHYNDTQVIMTSKRCFRCSKFAPDECARCLLNEYNPVNEASTSNLRFFDGRFSGIHVEVKLRFKDNEFRTNTFR